MPNWVLYAILSAVFAGLTGVLAKSGMKDINADLGLAVRTTVVLVAVLVNLFLWKGVKDVSLITPKAWMFLIISGLGTTLSWVCYYRAMKDGPVSYVAIIDKGSLLVTLLLAVVFLREPLTGKTLFGAGLMTAGLAVLAWK